MTTPSRKEIEEAVSEWDKKRISRGLWFMRYHKVVLATLRKVLSGEMFASERELHSTLCDFFDEKKIEISIVQRYELAKTLSGKVPKQFIPATEEEIQKIIDLYNGSLHGGLAKALSGKVPKQFIPATDDLRKTLREIGNIIGGPVTSYDSTIEVDEWRDRAVKISGIVKKALKVGRKE